LTYSIVAIDRRSKLVGVATVSGSVAVGSRVPWARHGVGAVATQAYTNPALGPRILGLMASGLGPREALRKALKEDRGREMRQVAVIDARSGESAVFSGSSIPREFGEYIGRDCACIANMVSSSRVAMEMCRAFEEAMSGGRSFIESLLIALAVGHEIGGDVRGDRSAAMVVCGSTPFGELYDRVVDARVDLSTRPLEDLRRVLEALGKL